MSGLKLSVAVKEIAEIVGKGMIHVQVLANTAEEMVTEAKKYKEYFGFEDNYYAKIPVTTEGFQAMRI